MDSVGLSLVETTDACALASDVAAWRDDASDDPFVWPLLLVPSAGMKRWLSQRIATSAPEGICAGLDVEPLRALPELVSGFDPDDDPWSAARLVWRIVELAESDTPGLDVLRHHLAATDQRYANARRIAGLFERYARLRPEMLASWSDAASVDELGLGIDSWQPTMWRALHTTVPGPDPVVRRATLLDDIRCGRLPLDAPAVGVFCPRDLTRPEADLLDAVGQVRPVTVWLRDDTLGSDNPLANRLGRRLHATRDLLVERAATVRVLPAMPRPDTLLGHLQRDIEAGVEPSEDVPADRTIGVHASHGLQRQVEVLREVLAGAFADDPTLEPRDVVVLTPDPDALGPHLSAVFGDPDHPGSTFRVQVTERGASDANELYHVVRSVLLLQGSRATQGQLLELATHPFVAKRFGIDPDDASRLSELIPEASVRWGINDAHRATFGLTQVRQGTWQVGVQRLLLGEALSDDDLASVGTISPVDDVDSSDVELLGALAELVSRVSRLAKGPDDTTAHGWIEHLRAIADSLVAVPFDESWQLAQFWSVLEVLARRSGDAPATLSPIDALALLDEEFGRRSARPAFGNGSLVVCSPAALAQVPHRLVCLVGLDEQSFPRRGIPDGDDLVARHPEPSDPSRGADDRQGVLDAILAATERLEIVYQGASGHAPETRPAPAGVADLVEAACSLTGLTPETFVVHEPLQSFSPAAFGAEGVPRSFDRHALDAARALLGHRAEARRRFEVGELPTTPPDAIDLDAVRSFLGDPAKYFLKERAGLTLGSDDAAPEELPIELDALQTWSIATRLLDALQRGHSLADAQNAEWLRGDLPPGHLGRRLLDEASATAMTVFQASAPYLEAPLDVHVIDLTVAGVRLTGRASLRGDLTVTSLVSTASAKHKASAWLDALALTVALERPVDAVVVGKKRAVRLRAPGPDQAMAWLNDIVMLALAGRDEPIPMPPRVAELWAECIGRNSDPRDERRLEAVWGYDRNEVWDALWPQPFKPWDPPVGARPWAVSGQPTMLGSAASLIWRPIVRAENR